MEFSQEFLGDMKHKYDEVVDEKMGNKRKKSMDLRNFEILHYGIRCDLICQCSIQLQTHILCIFYIQSFLVSVVDEMAEV